MERVTYIFDCTTARRSISGLGVGTVVTSPGAAEFVDVSKGKGGIVA